MVAAHLLLMNHFFMSLTHNSPQVGAFSDFNSVIVDVGCPIGCTQCSPINGCLACKPPFFLLLHREGTRQTASCTTTCPRGFYKVKKKRNGFCTKCTMRGCLECLAIHYCSVCDPEFVNFFGKCIKQPTDKELEELGVFVTRPPHTFPAPATTTTTTTEGTTTVPKSPYFTDVAPATTSTTATPTPAVLEELSPASRNTTTSTTTTVTTTHPERMITVAATVSTTTVVPPAVTSDFNRTTQYESDRGRCHRKYTRKKGRRRGGRQRNGRRKNGKGRKPRRRGDKRRRDRKKNGGRGRKERKRDRNGRRQQRRLCRRLKKNGRRKIEPGDPTRRPSEVPLTRDTQSDPPRTAPLQENLADSHKNHDLENRDVHRVRQKIKLSLLEEEKDEHQRRSRKESPLHRLKSETFFYRNRPLAMVEYKQSQAHRRSKPPNVNGHRVRHGKGSDEAIEE